MCNVEQTLSILTLWNSPLWIPSGSHPVLTSGVRENPQNDESLDCCIVVARRATLLLLGGDNDLLLFRDTSIHYSRDAVRNEYVLHSATTNKYHIFFLASGNQSIDNNEFTALVSCDWLTKISLRRAD